MPVANANFTRVFFIGGTPGAGQQQITIGLSWKCVNAIRTCDFSVGQKTGPHQQMSLSGDTFAWQRCHFTKRERLLTVLFYEMRVFLKNNNLIANYTVKLVVFTNKTHLF